MFPYSRWLSKLSCRRFGLVECVFVGGVIRNSPADGYWDLFYDVERVVGLCVDVVWMVVCLSIRTVGTVCKVEGDVQIVNNVHVCLYSYVKSMSLEASFPVSYTHLTLPTKLEV